MCEPELRVHDRDLYSLVSYSTPFCVPLINIALPFFLSVRIPRGNVLECYSMVKWTGVENNEIIRGGAGTKSLETGTLPHTMVFLIFYVCV